MVAVVALGVVAAAAFVLLGLVTDRPQAVALGLSVAPWRTTAGDAASAAGFAVTVAGLVLVVRAGQVGGARRTDAARLVDALDGERRRRAARAVAGRGATPEDLLHPARALATVAAARWTVTVLFAGLLLTALGRALVAVDAAALVAPLAACVVLVVLLVALARRARRARAYLLHHPDPRTPPAVLAALARWSADPA